MSLLSKKDISANPTGASVSHTTLDELDDKPRVQSMSVLQTAGIVWRSLRAAPHGWLLCLLSVFSAILSGPFILSLYAGYAFGLMDNQAVATGWLHQYPLWAVSGLALLLLMIGTFCDYAVNNLAASINAITWRKNISAIFGVAMHIQEGAGHSSALHSIKSFLADSIEVFQRHQLYILQNSVRSVLVVLLTLCYLLSQNPWFIAVVFFALAVTFFTPIWLANKAQSAIDEEPFALNRFNRYLLSLFRLGGVLSYNDNRHLFRQLQQHFQRYVAIEGKKWITWNFAFNFKVTLNLLTSVGLLTIGGFLYFSQMIDIAELIAIYLLVSIAVPRLDAIYKIYNYLQSLKAYYQQARHLQTLVPEDSETALFKAVTHIGLSCELLQLPGQDQPLFQGLELSLERGKVYLFRGKSGAGKTTLLNMLLGCQLPDQGQLRVNHVPLPDDQRKAYWQRIALHEQNNLLIANLTARENLQLVKRPIDAARFERAASALGFDAWADRPVKQLSGGEVQRLCFMRAYIYEADVFIFDEPTSALDGLNESLVKDLVRELNDAIVLIVSHSPGFGDLADCVWVSAGAGRWTSERGGRGA